MRRDVIPQFVFNGNLNIQNLAYLVLTFMSLFLAGTENCQIFIFVSFCCVCLSFAFGFRGFRGFWILCGFWLSRLQGPQSTSLQGPQSTVLHLNRKTEKKAKLNPSPKMPVGSATTAAPCSGTSAQPPDAAVPALKLQSARGHTTGSGTKQAPALGSKAHKVAAAPRIATSTLQPRIWQGHPAAAPTPKLQSAHRHLFLYLKQEPPIAAIWGKTEKQYLSTVFSKSLRCARTHTHTPEI